CGSRSETAYLSRKSSEFYLVQRIQDEVHRFAITFDRQLRGTSVFRSKLDNIAGGCEKRRRLLLKHFKSLDEIKTANIEEITKLGIPKNVAKDIISELKS